MDLAVTARGRGRGPRQIAQQPDAHVRIVGNPTAENLLAVIGLLQAEAGVRLHVRAVADAA